MPPRLAPDRGADRPLQGFVVGSGTHHVTQISLVRTQEAEPQLAIRGQPHPVARGAEWLGHRRDEPDCASRSRDLPEPGWIRGIGFDRVQDRKSTRLNSSHTVISYAVF